MSEKLVVIQTKPGQFTFRDARVGSIPKQVYLAFTPQLQEKRLVQTTTASAFTISLKGLKGRPYFYVEESEQGYMIAERNLHVSGMNNFRDLGGYDTLDGRRIKWGFLYRSDHLNHADVAGQDYLKGLGIHTIVDYRSYAETIRYPNCTLGPNVRTYQLDPAAQTAELSAQFSASKEDEDQKLIDKICEQRTKTGKLTPYASILTQYRNFVYKDASKKAFAAMLKVAADPSAPALLQHCRGGKDRTGFGAMLLLGVLGVPKDTLVKDYLLTQTNRISRNNYKMAQYRKLTSDEQVLQSLSALIETKEEFILTSINEIEMHYGSIRAYAMQELGLTEKMLANLCALYLE